MIYKQGDIILVPFPFTDQTGSKKRPAIVVSNNIVNKSDDVVIAQLTSQDISGPLSIEITNSDVSIPFKPPYNRQFIYCKKLVVIEKSLIEKKITMITNQAKKQDILKKIQSIFDLEKFD